MSVEVFSSLSVSTRSTVISIPGDPPLNHLSPDIKMHILLTVFSYASYGTSKVNLSKYQNMLPW